MEKEVVQITERGTLTLPSNIRKNLGIKGKQQMLLHVNERGEIVLRPAVTVPVEIYTDERIAEFREGEEELGKLLDKYFPNG